MAYTYKSPETEQEWRDYFELRWQILRAPWQQDRGSERDELEATAFHIMALDDQRRTIATGRLHRLSDSRAQIRYMAVHPDHQGRGIGARILSMLEQQAGNWACQEIVLNARSACLGFYQRHDYDVIAEAPTLFGSIAHKHMRKVLS